MRATKNRFGSTDEVGVFEMAEAGLREVADPARAFLADHGGSAPGSIVAPTLEGSRPLLVEVQALVSPTSYGNPTRKASGLDPNRLSLLIAVLGRRAGIALGSQDVYANLAGGLSVTEPGAGPAARPRPRLVVPRPADPAGDGGHRRGRAARRAAHASPGSSAGCARPPGSGSGGRSCPRPRGGARSPRSTGIEVSQVATLREAIEPRWPTGRLLVARRSPRC